MRILVAYNRDRLVGGAEAQLDLLLPALSQRGHEVGLVFETAQPATWRRIQIPAGAPTWNLSEQSLSDTLGVISRWKPDLLYNHGIADPEVESRLLDLCPALILAHNYYGTCVSGFKRFQFPVERPCSRTFGSACLAMYYPRRCGGWSPLTMWRGYRTQARRLRMLRRYRRILTLSEHMRAEYLRHGFSEEGVRRLSAPLTRSVSLPSARPALAGPPHRLAFFGRMETIKGGALLLEALELAKRWLPQDLDIGFFGQGADRKHWEEKAGMISVRQPGLHFRFGDFPDPDGYKALLESLDLVVVPSVWPEPFGLSAYDSVRAGVPVCGFAHAGILESLIEGKTGFGASADPPTADGLARALVHCLLDRDRYETIRKGAEAIARRWAHLSHLDELESIFKEVADTTHVTEKKYGARF